MSKDQGEGLPDRRPSCAYCGLRLAVGNRNSEHVVGRQFFPSPRPADLQKIVVPSCRRCNESYKHDEDYFRGLLCLSEAALSETGRRISAEFVARGLKRDRGVRSAIGRGIRQLAVRSPAGLHLPPRAAQAIDWDRVGRVMEKWVRGLHWKEFGQRVERETFVRSAMRPLIVLNENFHLPEPKQGAGCWPGTFEYWVSRKDARTRWTFRVWDSFGFAAMTNEEFHLIKADVYSELEDGG